MEKITDFKKIVSVKRRYRNYLGSNDWHTLEFLVTDNPTTIYYNRRILAKIIDYSLYVSFLCPIFQLSKDFIPIAYVLLLFLSVLNLFFINSFLECRFSTTIGKRILNLMVIDNYGKRPSLLLSMKRNFVAFFTPIIQSKAKEITPGLRRNRHNEICNTFVINRSSFKSIKERLQVKKT